MTTPIFTFDPEISVSSSTVSLSGTAVGDFTKADILANGSDIGSVQVADGQWTFDAAVSTLPSAVNFTLDVTDTSNNTASVNSNFRVLLDVMNHPYTAVVESKTANGAQSVECFNTDGRDLYNMSYTSKNSHDLIVSPHVHPNSFTFVSADASHETITDFTSVGKFHDMISMPSNDFSSMVDVLHNSSLSQGNWNITDPHTHSILTINGVTASDVRAAQHDFTFNGTGHIL